MNQDENSDWCRLMWWLFTIFGVPILIPRLIYYVFKIFKHEQKRNSLRGKVNEFCDQVVMITGASSGLGESLAHTFYRCGCKLILIARREQELQRVKETLLCIQNVVPTHVPIVFPLDLSEINSLPRKITNALKIYGRIDILINNAGISYRGEVFETEVDVDMKVMLINYFGQVALTKAVLPLMMEQKSGHLLYISSVQGKLAIPLRSAYTASKHALQAWSDSARAELSSKNINVTVISPGYIRTSLSLNALTGSGKKYGVMDETTENGLSPEYVAEKILKAILNEDYEIVIASSLQKMAIYLRILFPTFYFTLMQQRAKRLSWLR